MRGTLAIDRGPVVHGGAAESGGVGDGGEVQKQVGGSAERGVDDHGVADGAVGEDVAGAKSAALELEQGAGGARGHVEPDGLAGGRERGVGERHAEGFADDLRGGGGAEELAAAAGRCAGAATQLGGFLQA